jgi:signal transduction histidine kinase
VATLLDLSRLGRDRLELELEDVDLAELVREVVGRFADEAAHAGCEVRLALEPARGSWDRFRLDQVVTNLVANALKYGAGRPVTIAVGAAGDRARLEVRDEGIGIAPEAQVRIFERYERAVSEKNYGGFGLGLWIVRRIVEALGGEVRVESAVGRGATFLVELPRSPSGAVAHPELWAEVGPERRT